MKPAASSAVLVMLALLATAPSPVFAEGRLSAACLAAARTQADLDTCVAAEASEAEARLNSAYRAASCHLHGEDRARLRSAERAWVRFRDAECAFLSSGGDSVAPMDRASCRADLADKRADDLDSWSPNPAGPAAACR